MRRALQKLNGERLKFKATVKRFGAKNNYFGPPIITILLVDISLADTNQIVTNHLWLTMGKTLDKLKLEPGDTIEFEARVGEYLKGYSNNSGDVDHRRLDYKLFRPTKFKKLVDKS